MSLTSAAPQPKVALQFESSNVDSVTGLAPNLSTTGTYAATTGGTITTVAGQRIHTFTTVGTTSITFLVPVTAQVLVVAGGGGGGGCGTSNQTGGGGGAGELYYSASYSITPGTYTVTVGAGGTRGVGSGTSGGTPTNGSDSIFGTIDCNGGGRGGASGNSLDSGGSGGSGGGASRNASGGSSVKTAAGFGNAGGDSTGSLAGGTAGGGGGGGAGGAGAAAGPTNDTSAAGGAGRAYSISGASVTYAAGGSGGSRSGTADGAAGTTNRGNGGQGGDGNAVTNGGNGGSGIVVISYNAAIYPAPTYVPGVYQRAVNFNNTLSGAGADPNCYVTYDVTAFNLSTNSATMSLWLNSGLTYPTAAGTTPFYINLQGGNYHALYTAAATSNIACRTGAAPTVTVGNAAAQTSTWNHYCTVFSNVGAGTSNTITTYYANGSLVGFANNTIQSFTTLNIGCQNSGSNGALCSVDDVRLFNTALSSAQTQAIYAARGMPGIWNFTNSVGSSTSSLTGAPLFSRLSSGSAISAFSLRAVNGPTAKSVRVLRKSDNAQQDFWADRVGNLLTAPVTGQTLTTWLGGSAANVVTWYDQMSAGRNATGTQATIVQTSNVNQQWAINPTNGGLSLSGGAFLNGTDFTIVCTTKRLGTQGNDGVYGYGANASWVAPAAVATTYGANTRFGLVMPNAGSTAVSFNDSSYSAAFSSNANVVPSAFVAATEPTVYTAATLTGSTQRMYINGTTNGLPISTLTQVTANASTGFTIGSIGYYGNFLGEIGELIIFNSALSPADISTLYSAR